MTEALAELFDVLHDGDIVEHSFVGGVLKLKIEIKYLAERVRPEYRLFFLELTGVRDLLFQAWMLPPSEAAVITSTDDIFRVEIQILSATWSEAEGTVTVVLDQYSRKTTFAGGQLVFRADGFSVRDEAGEAISRSAQRDRNELLGRVCRTCGDAK